MFKLYIFIGVIFLFSSPVKSDESFCYFLKNGCFIEPTKKEKTIDLKSPIVFENKKQNEEYILPNQIYIFDPEDLGNVAFFNYVIKTR